MKKPFPEIMQILEMDLDSLLDYLDFLLPGTKAKLWTYYSNIGYIVSGTSSYLPLPNSSNCHLERDLLIREYPHFQDICFNIQ